MTAAATLPRPDSKARSVSRSFIRIAIYLVLFIGLWWGYAVGADVPAFLLPTPDAVWQSLVAMSGEGILWSNFAATFRSVALGFVVGTVVGIAVGYCIWRFRILREAMAPYLLLFQAAPKIAVVPLFVLWFGLGLGTQLALTLLLTFFPIMIAAQLGFASMSKEARDLGQILGLSRAQAFWKIQLPGATPDLFAGAKLGILDAIEGAFLAEFITAQFGLGYLMVLGTATYDAPMLFGAVILTVIVGLTGFGLIYAAERYFLRWRRAT
ncbi:ABC transporter permease [Agrococcus sp. Marseille-Q4369]|uniref:ABC transporter permease n=1 Tax=Agrococcus sp. Marseille-Q4369 TaxID=2810513 RepID=UPI001B8AEEEE|nr:ABC transporter permease [Agrococcus sp. Marseille-Q4369]QUW17831.1 ABC transporter permease [Agrococcus sp. Marseille-Q4369]